MPGPIHRRRFLLDSGAGLGSVALSWLLANEARAADAGMPPHFAARAKRVIQVFACGGVSHLDTFDYKPELVKRDGQELKGKGKIEPFFGQVGRLMKSPFAFRQHGESGRWVSEVLPGLASCVDDMTFLRAMVAKSSNHTPATFQMNSGFTMNGFPCLGAWLSYGLGTENEDLPTFVVLPDPRGQPAGGAINWTSGFLPANHQGVMFRSSDEPIADLFPPKDVPAGRRGAAVRRLQAMNREHAEERPGDSALEARIRAYELAGKMQASVPEAIDFRGESAATRRLYGLDSPATEGFGRNCLMARRLIERGVRFVQLYHGGAFGSPRINWDGHEDIVENHRNQAASMDGPLSGMLRDLKARGSWTTPWCSGRPSSAGPRSPRASAARGATITSWPSPAGWPARASRRASPTASRTRWATPPPRGRPRSTTSTRPCCTCWGSTTRS